MTSTALFPSNVTIPELLQLLRITPIKVTQVKECNEIIQAAMDKVNAEIKQERQRTTVPGSLDEYDYKLKILELESAYSVLEYEMYSNLHSHNVHTPYEVHQAMGKASNKFTSLQYDKKPRLQSSKKGHQKYIQNILDKYNAGLKINGQPLPNDVMKQIQEHIGGYKRPMQKSKRQREEDKEKDDKESKILKETHHGSGINNRFKTI